MLTSMIKKVDVAVAGAITDFDATARPRAASRRSTSRPVASTTRRPAASSMTSPADIDKLKEQIISGEIEVPITPQG
jgi:basic membrane lipoprotein Med (substrate-binding protein (PBP1-ABC) superfamily)